MRRHAGHGAARYLLVGAMSAVLAGCGGSSGDGTDGGFDLGPAFDPNDVDGDGVPNADDADYDPSDLDGDGIPNLEDDDVDGDGIVNELDDDYVAGDGDGDGFTDVSASDPCGQAGGSDDASVNNDWNDNCTVERFNQFADSLYSAGIQRVVYCSLDAASAPGSSVDAFTDGEFGAGTEEAVTAYQRLRGIGVDGRVGPETWGTMQEDMEIVTAAEFQGNGPFYDAYTVAGDRCGGAVLFYNEVAPADDGLSVDSLGWSLARGASDPERVPFSIASPFGRID